MTNEQARKLLGGYATNSLTEAERQALFEAALDDQALFDALQQEQGLKELLADPVSRHQVQQALTQPPAPARPVWSRWWAFGSLGGAVAASVLIFAVIRSRQHSDYSIASVRTTAQQEDARSATTAPPGITAPPEAKPRRLEPAPRKAVRSARILREPAAPATTAAPENSVALESQVAQPQVAPAQAVRSQAAPPPPPPAQATPAPLQQADQLRSQQAIQSPGGQQAQTFGQRQYARDAERAAATLPAPAAQQPIAGIGGFTANSAGPLLRYSLVSRNANGVYTPLAAGVPPRSGDAVRITVLPAVAGYLSLYELDPSGDWKRLTPATEPGLMVSANVAQTIPDSPIIVKDTEQKFRLMLAPLAQQAPLAKDSLEKSKATTAAAVKKADAPLVTDITIAAGKLP